MARALVLLSAVACLSSGCQAGGDVPDPIVDAGTDAGALSDPLPARDAGAPVERDSGPPLPRFEGLPIDCWLPRNSFCNPANNDGCRDDEACDLTVDPDGQPLIMCFPPPATEALGDTCDNQRGPFCAGGLRCMERRCMDTCCADAECTVAGERCVPLDPRYGALGVCRVDDAPDCGRPGDPCRQASDCCSRDCHIDHCH